MYKLERERKWGRKEKERSNWNNEIKEKSRL